MSGERGGKAAKRGHDAQSLREPLIAALTIFGRLAAKWFLQPARA